jgi:hypothetical protein
MFQEPTATDDATAAFRTFLACQKNRFAGVLGVSFGALLYPAATPVPLQGASVGLRKSSPSIPGLGSQPCSDHEVIAPSRERDGFSNHSLGFDPAAVDRSELSTGELRPSLV